MGGLSDIGDIAGLVGSIVGMAIAAIVLLTFAPIIAGDINAIALQSTGHCVLSNGELTDRVLDKGSHTTANEAWAADGASNVKVVNDSDNCRTRSGFTHAGAATAITLNTGPDTATVAGTDYYSAKGNTVATTITITEGSTAWTDTTPACAASASPTAGTCEEHIDSGEWKEASKSLTSLAGGSLVSLLFGAMAILLPAGALGFLGYFGATIVKQQIGGGTLAVAIGATVAVVIIGSILPSIFTPLDALFIALDGNRYFIYSQGIGQLGSVLGNFLGISLIGGLITLGILLWQGRDGSSSGTKGML